MKASKVVSSILYNYLGTGFITITGFAYTAFVVHRLSHARFGILVLTTSIISYSNLLDLGIGITVMKMVAERAHAGPTDEITTIVRNAIAMFVAIGAVVFAVLLGMEPFVGGLFKVSGENLHLFQTTLAIAALGIGVSFPSAIYTAVHQAHGDYRYMNVLGILTQALQVGVGMVLLLAGFGIVALVSLTAALNVVGFCAKIRHSRKRFGVKVRQGKFSWAITRQMFSMSVWIFLMNFASHLIFSTDNIVVGAVIGTSAVASFQVALGPASTLQTAGDQFNMVSLTAAASLRAQGAMDDLRRLLLEATRLVAAVAMPGVVVFALWGRQLLALWVGRSFESSLSTLVVLSIGYLLAALEGAANQVVLALNRYRLISLLSLAEAAANLILSVILAKRMGILGVALGTTIPLTVMALGIYIPLACRLIELPYSRLLRRLALPVAVNAAVYGILRLVAAGPKEFSNLLVLLTASAGVFAVCFGLSVMLDSQERSTYIGMLRQQVAQRKQA
ncbi:MAG: oligosaccharide flippase family protein [Acidimicrobiales bacterium]|jgi:O-antigen/teichoic acid export membrane protein